MLFNGAKLDPIHLVKMSVVCKAGLRSHVTAKPADINTRWHYDHKDCKLYSILDIPFEEL